jgi:hypothetical protein
MAVKLDDERREILVSRLRGFFSEEFEKTSVGSVRRRCWTSS